MNDIILHLMPYCNMIFFKNHYSIYVSKYSSKYLSFVLDKNLVIKVEKQRRTVPLH